MIGFSTFHYIYQYRMIWWLFNIFIPIDNFLGIHGVLGFFFVEMVVRLHLFRFFWATQICSSSSISNLISIFISIHIVSWNSLFVILWKGAAGVLWWLNIYGIINDCYSVKDQWVYSVSIGGNIIQISWISSNNHRMEISTIKASNWLIIYSKLRSHRFILSILS